MFNITSIFFITLFIIIIFLISMSNLIKTNSVYYTSASIVAMGKNGKNGKCLIAVDLNDADLPTNVDDPHMTVLYCNEGIPDQILQQIKLLKIQYLHQLNKTHLSFTLQKWGKESDKIFGELYNFCKFIRNKYTKYKSKRLPHVRVR